MSGGAVILGGEKKRAAREIVIAPRLPRVVRPGGEDTFHAEGDVVLDCDVEGCGWHAWAPRVEAKDVIREHHRVHHPESTGVVLLNQPRQ